MILLDTHIWVWWVQGDARLHQTAFDYLDGLGSRSIAVSAISFWEIALLAQRDRIRLPDPPVAWLDNASTDPRIEVLPITSAVAMHAALLLNTHKDPADRLLISHAMLGSHTLMTVDSLILANQNIKAIHPARIE